MTGPYRVLQASRRLRTYLKEASPIGSSPRIEEVVFASSDEPFPSVGKLKRKHTRLVQVQLVLLCSIDVQYLHVTALHTGNRQTSHKIYYHATMATLSIGTY